MENVTLQQLLCSCLIWSFRFFCCVVYVPPNLILASVFKPRYCCILSLTGKCRKRCWKGLNVSLSSPATNITLMWSVELRWLSPFWRLDRKKRSKATIVFFLLLWRNFPDFAKTITVFCFPVACVLLREALISSDMKQVRSFYVLERDINGVWWALKAKEHITQLFCRFG